MQDEADWVDILLAKGLEAPMDAPGQYLLALKVACPWHKCMAPSGERCRASLVFPQYPHTSRLRAAALEERAETSAA